MSENALTPIEYRTSCRLADQLKLQFWCTYFAFWQIWYVFAFLIFIIFAANNFSISEVLRQPLSILFLTVCGLIGAFVTGPVIIVCKWLAGKSPKEIKADIGNDDIKIIGRDINYETKWSGLTWAREGRQAYILKFKSLMFRLPKRGFAGDQEACFRAFIIANAPTKANKLKA